MSTFTTYVDSAQQGVASSSTGNAQTQHAPHRTAAADDDAGKKKKTSKRRKVNHASSLIVLHGLHRYLARTGFGGNSIKREIGHLCHDERRPKVGDKPPNQPAGATNSAELATTTYAPVTVYQGPPPQPTSAWPMTIPPYIYQVENFGNEFSVLTDFLETLDDGSFFTPPTTIAPSLVSSASFHTANQASNTNNSLSTAQIQPTTMPNQSTVAVTAANGTTDANGATNTSEGGSTEAILPAATKTEKFLLTAADQEPGSRDERLNRVIRSKYEAGLLKPYNYVKGYARLSRWMDRNVSQESKQQILQPLSVLRPKFRAVAQSLRDLDLVFIEEAFERMLLDYDRVFSAMGVPACLWRRTGEIYKGNREFSELVGVDGYMMRDGRLCIYELMAEESAVNYWEKYGHVAFDSSQKAVLTSCVLRYKPVLNSGATSPIVSKAALEVIFAYRSVHVITLGGPIGSKKEEEEQPMEEGFINCCFSFTIRRDKWGIPSMIVGNFIKC
ncbi:hypothetical protein NLJ89_g7725 [Agrocybe chaxingu]|uniref:ERT1/acuK family PAS domain-containing protein n=1 Tax=Agrocybe chaxingu TaxID=84603 RepID=A0A9W8JW34_9AGAR|nr:hypothetical protein NLJ89_g7725 [Agrocybe chaxingu]